MRRVSLTVCATMVALLPWSNEAFALERTALALSGQNCRSSHQAMIETLEQLEGIVKVGADVIPDHLLVDHDGRHLTAEELTRLVNALAAGHGRCRAAVMRSCITADFGTRAAHAESEH